MDCRFSNEAFEDYLYWQSHDRKTLKRINTLLLNLQRNGIKSRMGHAEILKGKAIFSMRIDKENRLLYYFNIDEVVVLSLRGHYSY